MPDAAELIPPPWFVHRLNMARAELGLPFLSPLDGIVMLAWHEVSKPPPGNLLLVTGI